MFHVELRHFPHNTHAFNLTEAQLRGTIVEPLLRNQPVELGERRWAPETTTLTILEGPELSTGDLAMGRGWAAARRQGRDVTDPMLRPPPAAPARLDSLALELLSMCLSEPVSLHQVWRLATSWHPGWRVSDRLTAAEGAARAVLLGGYAHLCRGTRATAAGHLVPGPDIEPLLLALASWIDDGAASVFLVATDFGRLALQVPEAPAAPGGD